MMRRIALMFVAALVALIGLVSLTLAAQAVPSVEATAYTYDAPAYDDLPGNCAAPERGPPAHRLAAAAYDAVDHWSHGTWVRADAASRPAITTYAYPRTFAQGAGATSTTSSDVVPADGSFSTSLRSAVAANTGDDLLRVGRWMSEEEYVAMSRDRRVIEGGSGRTFVTTPANPAAYPAGKGVFAEFDVPRGSIFPASKPERGVIPGPNVTTTRFGPPPTQMPPATCITLVCRR